MIHMKCQALFISEKYKKVFAVAVVISTLINEGKELLLSPSQPTTTPSLKKTSYCVRFRRVLKDSTLICSRRLKTLDKNFSSSICFDIVHHLFFFQCLGKAVLSDGGFSWVTSFIFFKFFLQLLDYQQVPTDHFSIAILLSLCGCGFICDVCFVLICYSSPSFGAPIKLCSVIVAFPRYLNLYMFTLANKILNRHIVLAFVSSRFSLYYCGYCFKF